MSTAPSFEWLSVEDYLNGELHSQTKYEYVDGRVYAMADLPFCRKLTPARVTSNNNPSRKIRRP